MPINVTEDAEYASGTNVHAAYTIPEARVCGYGTSTTAANPINRLSVTGAAKLKGVTRRAIAPGQTGDVAVEGVTEVETDGAGTVQAGDRLAASVSVDSTGGRVYSTRATAPAAGAVVHLVGIAEDGAPAVAGTRIRVRLTPGATLTGTA
ncbi:MAG: capsid cement protein [Polyangiales bacterium]